MISFDQFRHAIETRIIELQALPPSAQRDADIAQLQTILAGLPPENVDS